MEVFPRFIFFIIISGGFMYADSTSLPNEDAVTDHLIAQILDVWSIINIAQSIATEDNAKFNDEIFRANLELYAKMYYALHIYNKQHPHNLEPMYDVLNALRNNHDDLCNLQNEHESAPLRKLMSAILAFSQKFLSESDQAMLAQS